jgi:hypothetical protein
VIAADETGRFEGAHATQAGRRRDADAPRQRDIGHAPVRLQELQDAAVDTVELWPAHAQFRPLPRLASKSGEE